MKTITDWFREQQGWRRERCGCCQGHGIVSSYGWGGDFEGPEECDSCCGNGHIWRTPRGRYVAYPGGPFC